MICYDRIDSLIALIKQDTTDYTLPQSTLYTTVDIRVKETVEDVELQPW